MINFRWLSAFLGLNIADCILTGLSFQIGAQELNPVLSSFSYPWLVTVKLTITICIGFIIMYLKKGWLNNLALAIIGSVVAYTGICLSIIML